MSFTGHLALPDTSYKWGGCYRRSGQSPLDRVVMSRPRERIYRTTQWSLQEARTPLTVWWAADRCSATAAALQYREVNVKRLSIVIPNYDYGRFLGDAGAQGPP